MKILNISFNRPDCSNVCQVKKLLTVEKQIGKLEIALETSNPQKTYQIAPHYLDMTTVQNIF